MLLKLMRGCDTTGGQVLLSNRRLARRCVLKDRNCCKQLLAMYESYLRTAVDPSKAGTPRSGQQTQQTSEHMVDVVFRGDELRMPHSTLIGLLYVVATSATLPQEKASDSYLDSGRAPCVLYGVKYIGLVSLALHITNAGQWPIHTLT